MKLTLSKNTTNTNKIQKIFGSEDFNEMSIKELENKYKNEVNFQELITLKSIYNDILTGAFKLTKDMLDHRGNRLWQSEENKTRGNKPYYPPMGWIGIGLNVKGKYEDDNWIGNHNNSDEWCVAYHGVSRGGSSSDEIKNNIGNICKTAFRVGPNQVHQHCPDKYHEGKTVGIGVYICPNPKEAEGYGGIIEINGKKFRTLLMVRVKPDAIGCDGCQASETHINWIVNGTTNEIRPYKILFKEC